MATNPALDTLMSFRFAYLRAIAHSWALWAPSDKLKDQDQFIRNLLSGDDIQPILKDSFGMSCGWPDLAVCLAYNSDPSRGWQSVPPFGWVGTDDKFIITLPQKPTPDPNDDVAVQALAHYYYRWPTIMGWDAADDGKVRGTGVPGAAPGGGEGELLEFGSVILRVIALAWQDPGFLSALTAPDLTDATPVLSQYLGYNSPFNFQIKFSTAGSLIWRQGKVNPNLYSWHYEGPDNGHTKIHPNAILLHFPAPPMLRSPGKIALDKSVWPFALASYNNTGEAYPFTCMGS
jgi:ribosomally synthesized peptide (two-chain TOMM family)